MLLKILSIILIWGGSFIAYFVWSHCLNQWLINIPSVRDIRIYSNLIWWLSKIFQSMQFKWNWKVYFWNCKHFAYWWKHIYTFILMHFMEHISFLVLSYTLCVQMMGYYFLDAKHLTIWGRDKMDAIFQTTFSNGFSWMKMSVFWLKFHWSLFLGAQLPISQHWFR